MKQWLKGILKSIPQVKRYHDHLKSLADQRNNRIEAQLNEIIDMYDNYVDETWSGVSRKQVCLLPYRNFDVYADGSVYTCCTAYLRNNYSIGDIYIDKLDDIWNSDRAKRLRYSVSKGNYEYCKRRCPNFENKESSFPRTDWDESCIKDHPKAIGLYIDCTCNLYCPSCRSSIIASSPAENRNITNILMNVIRPALKDCELLTVSPAGEFLASKPIMNLLKTLSREEFPNLKISVITNAQLFTDKRWTELPSGMIDTVSVSVDSTEKDTYETLRRGGKWETLQKNLAFIATLRRSGEIRVLQLNFVMQAANFRQIPAFIATAKQIGADRLCLQQINNMGTFSKEEFDHINIFAEQHPNHSEFQSILADVKGREQGIDIEWG